MHADSVRKSLRQNFFFARAAIVSAGKNLIFRDNIMDTNRDSAHQSRNEDNFATFSLGLELLNKAEKEKNNGKGDSASAPSRFASQSGEMQQSLLILLSAFRVGFDAQVHRLLMHNSTDYVIK